MNAGKVIIVQYATYAAPKRGPSFRLFFCNCVSCVFNYDDSIWDYIRIVLWLAFLVSGTVQTTCRPVYWHKNGVVFVHTLGTRYVTAHIVLEHRDRDGIIA